MDVCTGCDLTYTRAALRLWNPPRTDARLRRSGCTHATRRPSTAWRKHMPDSSLSGGDMALVAIVLVISLAALGFAAFLVKAVLAADQGTTKMREIAQAVQEGAAAYLRRQFRTLGVFAVIVFVLLLLLPVHDGGWGTRLGRAIFFLVGATFSALVGFIGMTLATRANVRVAQAANTGGYLPSFRTAYRTGGVVGMITIGLGLLGASVALLVFQD